MDSQEHKKNHTSGQDGHGVHLCHKCGWPFPNPHPSAKHRRSHKKICGTIEGYKLEERVVHSDDEHASDEDRKTPSPKGLERSSGEKGSGGLGERSNRSEDDVFTDAAAEFNDSGSSLGSEEHMNDIKEPEIKLETINTTAVQSFEDGAVTVTSPPSNSAESIQLESTEVPVNNPSRCAQEVQDHVSTATIGSIARSLTDCRTEESAQDKGDDNGSSALESIPMTPELQTDASQENNKSSAGEVTETDAKENEGTELDRQLPDVVVSTNDNAGEASDAASQLGKTEDVASCPVPAADVIQLKEDHSGDLGSDVSVNDLSPELKSIEPMTASIGTAQLRVDPAQGLDSTSFVESTEGYNDKGESNDKVESNEKVHVLTVPDNIPVADNAEDRIKGFKDLEGGKLPQSINVDSFELINNVKDNLSGFNSSLSAEGPKVSASDVHELRDDRESKHGINQVIVQEVPDEVEANVPQSKFAVNENQTSEVGAVTDVVAINKEKSLAAQSPEEELPHDYCSASSLTSSLEHATKGISNIDMDAKIRETNCLGSVDNAGNNSENDKIESSEIAVNDNRRNTEDSSAGIRVPTSEPTSIFSENVNQGSDVFEDVDSASREEHKVERHGAYAIDTEKGDSISGSVEENLSGKEKPTPESAVNLPVSHVTLENQINASEGKISERECTHLECVSGTEEGRKEPESKGVDNVLAERPGEGSTAAELNSGGDVEVLQKSSEDNMLKESVIPSSDTSSSLQNPVIVEDSQARDFVEVASVNRSESLPDESDNNFVPQLLGASAADFSVDSSSQTDSLEGHWGSISVLSTQSDIPAVLDAEPLPSHGSQASAEAEKATFKKKKTASEDKSDIFEPPSFMTLVEPKGGSDQIAAASEIQMTQNPQQPKAASTQAGWFPSITNVVNESQGRKKNEEIIAKVTNWSTSKPHSPMKSQHHTPLKSLLGEANVESKSKSTNAKEDPVSGVQKNDSTAKDNGALPATVSSTLGPQAVIGDPVKSEEEKAWSSPARYPADIKREKRKVKGRPYWAQFVCCSSVN